MKWWKFLLLSIFIHLLCIQNTYPGVGKFVIKGGKLLIKNKKLKKKNIAGTIFMYSPFHTPVGFIENKTLYSQDFDFDARFHHIQIQREIPMFRASIKGYEGQLVEIRTLFNLNIRIIL